MSNTSWCAVTGVLVVLVMLALTFGFPSHVDRDAGVSSIASYDKGYARALRDTAYCAARNINPCRPGISLGI